jgi:type VI secretion system secreted protein VgrG
LVVGAISKLGMGESKSRASDGTSGGKSELTDTYRCSFHAIPGDTPFRLDRKTPRPLIRGPQTAKVVGQSGQEITTDQYGRIKVKFPWDRSAAQDETCSCWIRVSQAWAGANWGAMVIPRIGQEVIVEFLEGNPDRPIVTGSVYNANVTIPYAMPDNMTRTTLKSNSSQGGGGFNELRFEDKKGEEEVFFHAQKDFNKTVLNNETVTITQDYATTIQQGNHTTTVSQGNHSTTVSQGNHGLTVSQGNHTITVSAGSSTITAAQSITLQVGSNSITIDTSGITISAAQVTVQAQATMTLQAGASMTIAGAMVAIN